jgi:Flp pilus assembly pilin Flp
MKRFRFNRDEAQFRSPARPRLLARFRQDRSGATAVQAIVLLPVIIATFWSLFVVWQVVQMRESLHYATYQAVRYLSLYPLESADAYQWSQVADKIVVQELRNNPFMEGPASPLQRITDYDVEVELLSGDYQCKDKFRITTYYNLRAIPGGDGGRFGMPRLTSFRLNEVREGEILCQ